jgi:hypothetical protein
MSKPVIGDDLVHVLCGSGKVDHGQRGDAGDDQDNDHEDEDAEKALHGNR